MHLHQHLHLHLRLCLHLHPTLHHLQLLAYWPLTLTLTQLLLRLLRCPLLPLPLHVCLGLREHLLPPDPASLHLLLHLLLLLLHLHLPLRLAPRSLLHAPSPWPCCLRRP